MDLTALMTDMNISKITAAATVEITVSGLGGNCVVVIAWEN